MNKKLLVIGSNSIHIHNYIRLIDSAFDDILLITNTKNTDIEIKTVEVNFSLNINFPISIKKIRKIIRKFNPTVIHIHQANSYALISLLALGKQNFPVVLTAWGSDILIAPQRNMILKFMVKYILKQVTIATSDSLYMASEMRKYYRPLNVQIANFGIDNTVPKMKKEKIIYSNRLHKKLYNIDKVIKNFAQFVQKNNDWKLIIAATGDETESLKCLVEELGITNKVEFLGWIDSMKNNEIYQKASIYISIPDSDATSISLLEAIAYNCVCFVSNLPANYEHIIDGVNGFIVSEIDNINFTKYESINTELLKKCNHFKKIKYSKAYNKKIFLDIYDDLMKKVDKC